MVGEAERAEQLLAAAATYGEAGDVAAECLRAEVLLPEEQESVDEWVAWEREMEVLREHLGTAPLPQEHLAFKLERVEKCFHLHTSQDRATLGDDQRTARDMLRRIVRLIALHRWRLDTIFRYVDTTDDLDEREKEELRRQGEDENLRKLNIHEFERLVVTHARTTTHLSHTTQHSPHQHPDPVPRGRSHAIAD